MSADFISVDFVGNASWFKFLVCGDKDSLSPAEMQECLAWLKFHDVLAIECIGTDTEGLHYGLPDGTGGQDKRAVITYIFHSCEHYAARYAL